MINRNTLPHCRRKTKTKEQDREDNRNWTKRQQHPETTDNRYSSLDSESDEKESHSHSVLDHPSAAQNESEKSNIDAMYFKPFKAKHPPNGTPSVVCAEASDRERDKSGDDSDYSYAYGHFQDQGRQQQPGSQHNYYNMQERGHTGVSNQQQDRTLPGQDPDNTSESVSYARIMHTNNEDYYNTAHGAGEDMVIEDNELYGTNDGTETQQTTDEQEDEAELVVEDNELYGTKFDDAETQQATDEQEDEAELVVKDNELYCTT